MFVCKHELPKIYMGRIQKYWDKLLPSDIPVSGSSFSTTFASSVAATAVATMEAEIKGENSILIEALPENTYVSNYVGVYDVTGTPGELTLLCPEKVSSENVVAMHYVEESDTWENIADIQIIDGYVWGTLESFSPIAVFEYKPDIVLMDSKLTGLNTNHENVLIANGNTVKIYTEEDKIFAVGPSGVPVELTKHTHIVGGTIDGTPVENTNVSVVGVRNLDIVSHVYSGSFYVSTEEVPFTTVNNAVLNIIDSDVHSISGSIGAVRTNNSTVNINKNSTAINVATGRSQVVGGKDQSGSVSEEPNFGFKAWVKNAHINAYDSTIEAIYCSTDSGNTYCNNSNVVVENCKLDYLLGGGSNGKTDSCKVSIKNSEIGIFQSVNRGKVVSFVASLVKCDVENLYIGGDASDKKVTGLTESVKLEIGAGTYNIIPGTDGGELITTNDIVESIKVSRSAEVTISDELVSLLGGKYIVK